MMLLVLEQLLSFSRFDVNLLSLANNNILPDRDRLRDVCGICVWICRRVADGLLLLSVLLLVLVLALFLS